jgi:hypothetical protein
VLRAAHDSSPCAASAGTLRARLPSPPTCQTRAAGGGGEVTKTTKKRITPALQLRPARVPAHPAACQTAVQKVAQSLRHRVVAPAVHKPAPTATLRSTMKPTPLRSLCKNAARDTAISTHAPNPRDSSRLSTWLRLRRIDSIFAFAAHHCACRHTQPRARLRSSKASSSLRLAQELRTLCYHSSRSIETATLV